MGIFTFINAWNFIMFAFPCWRLKHFLLRKQIYKLILSKIIPDGYWSEQLIKKRTSVYFNWLYKCILINVVLGYSVCQLLTFWTVLLTLYQLEDRKANLTRSCNAWWWLLHRSIFFRSDNYCGMLKHALY